MLKDIDFIRTLSHSKKRGCFRMTKEERKKKGGLFEDWQTAKKRSKVKDT